MTSFTTGAAALALDRPVFQAFEGHARINPNQIAISSGAGDITYGELNARANRLAHWLRGRGAREEILIGVHLDRRIELVVAVLAVLKSGAAYLPIDPVNPAERVRQFLADARARLVLCGADHVGRLGALGVEPVAVDGLDLAGLPDEDPRSRVRPDNLAYLIYTSGSTGVPKGVMVSHRALSNLVRWIVASFGMKPSDQTGMVCSPGFDASMCEVWPPLCAGASIDIPGGEILLSPETTIRWLVERRITVGILPTPLAEPVLRSSWPTGSAMRVLLTGGDRLHVRPDPKLPFRLVNNYGPTENTAVSTSGTVAPASDTTLPSIGTAVPGTVIEILDSELRPVVDGAAGDLYLGGRQLARGYLGRPDLTAERFIPCVLPDRPGERLYRTGDICRRLPCGDIEFLGRADDQVKLRGQRVEVAEVTAALAAHPLVGVTEVVARGSGDATQLVAYVVPKDPRRLPAASGLRQLMLERLPHAMAPAAFVILDALPRTASGKIDRGALPEPDLRASAGAPYVAPRTATERAIAEVWCEVLGLDCVGAEDRFFDLGGHSLVATQIVARIRETLGVDVPIREVFTASTLARFASAVDELREVRSAPALPPIEAGSGHLVSPLSLAQQQVWFIGELSPGNIAYHAQATIRVTGPLDLDVLARALTELTRRHESLRTTYEERDGQPCQVVHPVVPFPLARIDLGHLSGEDAQARLEELVRSELRRPFDLARLPLVRWTAIRLGPDEHELVLVEHHMVHDGWSVSVLMRELESLYNAFARGEPSPLPQPPIQYRDYVRWQRDLLSSKLIRQQLDYWKDRLRGAGSLSLPTDRPRPKAQTFRGELIRPTIPPELPGQIRELCRRTGTSLFMIMYAAFIALLHRYTGDTDICIASGFANRRLRETEALIGMLVNPLVLRCQVAGATAFRDLLAQAREVVLDAADNQESPYPLVVNALGLERDPARNPLTQVMFSCHDSAVRNPELRPATSTIFERGNGTAKMDLNIIVVPRAKSHLGPREQTDDRITVLWEYNTDLFEAETMTRMADAYVRLLADAVRRPSAAVSDLHMLDRWDLERLLVEWSVGGSQRLSASHPQVHELVLERCRMQPEAVAVVHGQTRMTFGELDRRSARLAARLRELGAGRERVVSICLPRGANLVTAELGALRSGAALLPLDTDMPRERMRHMLRRSDAVAVVATRQTSGGLFRTAPTLIIEDVDGLGDEPDRRDGRDAGDDLAYVIYTSGSTGEPKGAMVHHRGFANLVAWHQRRFDLGPSDRVTSVASPGFDFSLWEIWPALAAGASVHFPDAATLLSPSDFQRWLEASRITVTLLPTGLGTPLLRLPWPATSSLRTFVIGGEQLTVRPAPTIPFRVVNAYGPTEISAIATTGEVEPGGADLGPPSIGRPIDGVTLYIVDPRLNLVAPGTAGEIVIGGSGVGRGYVGRPDLSAERFVPDPFAARPGQRLYRTGDLARHRPDGTLEFLGRTDAQIKLRGYRVEPAEVVSRLRQHPAVRDAYVTSVQGPEAERRLVAYVVGEEPRPGSDELRAHLRRHLPDYMMPAHVVWIDALPLNRNGKVDWRALPAPEVPLVTSTESAVTGTERRLAGIWQEVLNLKTVRAVDSFFDVGGHSLLLAQVQRCIEREFGRPVPLLALFEHPTVRSFARYLEGTATDPLAPADELGKRRQDVRGRLRRRRTARGVGPTTDGELR